LNFPAPYIDYLFHFHGDRDYFECHEVLEEHWKKNGMKRDSIWVGLIQIAVGFYHYRRGNVNGAVKMMDKALRLLTYKQDEVQLLGIHHQQLIKKLKNSKLKMKGNLPFIDINLPIYHKELKYICLEQCNRFGYEWGSLHDEVPYAIINKHKLRDRSSVIAEREIALAEKKKRLLLA